MLDRKNILRGISENENVRVRSIETKRKSHSEW